jgi:hypothetical protein
MLEIKLQELGIPRWADVGESLRAYDPAIKTRQMKIDGLNRWGYDWHTFFPTWKRYLSEKEFFFSDLKNTVEYVELTPHSR